MVATFTPPHPPPVFRVLKQAYREYLAGGNAVVINVTKPPNQAASATTVVAGTVERAPGVPFPPSVSVALVQTGATKATQAAPVDQATGAYTTTFPGSTLAIGTAIATVTSTSPNATAQTTAFTVS